MNDFLIAYRRYAQFEGRSGRKEFWYFVLFYLVASAILAVVDGVLFRGGLSSSGPGWSAYSSGPLTSVFSLASFIPSLAISIRRLHDIDKSGWFVLFGLIPLVGWIFLLVWYCQKGDAGDNRFGAPTPIGTLSAATD